MKNELPFSVSSAPSVYSPTIDPERERSNWDVLSLLRFILALIVALDHLRDYAPLTGSWTWLMNLGSFEAIFGFLLISGFSIGHSIQTRPEGFFRRRMLRIYPVYLAATLLTLAIRPQPVTFPFAGFFLLNLLFLGQLAVRYSYVGAAWSLDLEVWLYGLAPLLRRLRPRGLELLIGASFLCYIFYTCGRSLYRWPHYAGTTGGINLPCLAFIWIAGFYLATTVRKRKRGLNIVGALFVAHVLLGLGIQVVYRIRHHAFGATFATDGLAFLSPCLLLLAIFLIFRGIVAHRFHLRLFPRRIFHFLGDISYPLYLVHLPIYLLLATWTRNPVLLVLAALMTATAVYFGCDFYSQRRKSN